LLLLLISASQTAALYPKVIGSACWPWVLPANTTCLYFSISVINPCCTSLISLSIFWMTSLSCNTLAESIISLVVAPQLTYCPYSLSQATDNCLINGTIG